MADIYIGGVGCECCGVCTATEVCTDCFVTGPYKLILTRVRFAHEASDCLSFDWSPTDQCIPLCGSGDPGDIDGSAPGGTFTVSGQAFTLSLTGSIHCFSSNRLGLEAFIEIILLGCTGSNISAGPGPIQQIFYVGDTDVCDPAAMLGDYELPFASTGTGQWTLNFTFAEGIC